MGGELGDELAVGQDASLRETICSTAGFNKDETIVYQVKVVIWIDDGLRKGYDGDVYVFFASHGSSQVEIWQVKCS
jgi:hypothetical protein